GADERVYVRVAADDAVHDDDVVRIRRLRDEVADAALDAVAQPALGEQLLRFLLVLAGELDVGGAFRAGGEQLELDRAHTAADLEHRRAGHVARELHEIAGSPAHAAPAVAPRVEPRLLRAEHPLV